MTIMNERNTKWKICKAAMLSGLFLIAGIGTAYAQTGKTNLSLAAETKTLSNHAI